MAGIAGVIASSRIYSADANNIGLNLEMDAILAVALGGNEKYPFPYLFSSFHSCTAR